MALKYEIDLKSAEEEFEKICDNWEIDIDISEMNEDEKVDFEGIKRRIIKAIRLKRLFCNDDGDTLSYTVSKKSCEYSGDVLTIKRPKGEASLSTDNYKIGKDAHKSFSYISAMVGKPVQYLSKLDGIDMKVIQSFVQLFLSD